MSDQKRKVGEFLDLLGVEATYEPDEIITDAVVLLKVVDGDGDVHLRTAWSPRMSWIDRLGMLTAATAVETPTAKDTDDD